MFSYSFFQRTENGPIQLRLINNRRKADMSLSISASAEDFADALSKSPKPKNAGLSRLISNIDSILRGIQYEHMEEGKSGQDVKITRDEVSRRLNFGAAVMGAGCEEKVDKNKLFAPFFMKSIRVKTNDSYRASCDYTYKKIAEYCKEVGEDFDSMTFDGVTLGWLRTFDEWLTSKGAARNSRNIHFKNIRTVINRAIDEELTDKYPFRRFKIRAEETRKRSLALTDLRRLFTYECEEYQKFYIDMFKLVFMFIGINAVDLYNLQNIENGRIEYRRAKTKRLYSIKVEPEALKIIERWKGSEKLLCIADRWKDHKDFTKNINIALKKIGKVEIVGRGGKKKITPEWPELSLYWARHTWATIAADIDVPDATISLALGHKADNPTTEIYINRNKKKIDAANRRVLDWVLYGK